MGFLQRLFGQHETRDAAGGFSGFNFAGFGPAFGAVEPQARLLTARMAENLATVLACVNAIAGTIATLPAFVYQAQDGGRIEAPDHPVSALIRAPNGRQTWCDFVEWLVASTLLYGNGLAVIETDSAGRPVALIPVPWPYVQMTLLPSGRLAYDVVAWWGQFAAPGLPRRYLQSEVIHLKDRTDDAFVGRSRVSRAPDTVTNALGLQSFTTQTWRQGALVSGVLKSSKKLTQDAFDRLRQNWQDLYGGVHQARRTALLEDGVDFQPISINPEDAEVLQSRRFSVEEIARLFGVPPPILQDYTRNTFSNAATAGSWFGQFTILPWCRKIEAEFQRQVFGPASPFHLEMDMSGLMRGDYSQRWAANVAAVNSGILSPNEVREAEGFNPRSDGDLLRTMPGASIGPGSDEG